MILLVKHVNSMKQARVAWRIPNNFSCKNLLIFFLFVSLGVSDDSGEDERTGIAEGGWRKEKASSKTQLNEDMEKESGEAITVTTMLIIYSVSYSHPPPHTHTHTKQILRPACPWKTVSC